VSPDGEIAAIAARQHGAFTRTQAIDAGFTPPAILHRRRTGRWTDLRRGVFAIAGAPPTHEQRVVAAVLSFGPGALAASVTAAWLLGLVERPGDFVYVLLPDGQHRGTRKGVVVREAALTKGDIRKVKSIPCTAPERTIIDLAAVLTERAVEAALDDAVQLGLTTVPKLARYIRSRNLGRRPGTRTLKRLLDDRTKGVPQKELEKIFLRRLRAANLPEPVRQHPCGGFFIDFAYPAPRIAVELDGRAQHFSGRAFRDDPRRQNRIVLAGFDVLRFTWDDLHDLWEETEAVLREALGL
jgi:very-short-patch-repair endonuclease